MSSPDHATPTESAFSRPGGAAMVIAASPFIYGLILPFVLLDLAVSIYQAVCFRLWRMPRVARSAYVGIARHDLAYLTRAQRVNCAYCSYVNGLVAYVGEVASRTEQFWCPIQHPTTPLKPHARYDAFIPYGDSENIRARLAELRRGVQAPEIPEVPAPDGADLAPIVAADTL